MHSFWIWIFMSYFTAFIISDSHALICPAGQGKIWCEKLKPLIENLQDRVGDLEEDRVCMDGFYEKLTQDYRNFNSPVGSAGCDGPSSNNDWKGPGWYRMMKPAGVQIPEHPVPKNHCGAHGTGWLRGTHPKTPRTTVTRTVCFNWGSNSCNWQIDIQI